MKGGGAADLKKIVNLRDLRVNIVQSCIFPEDIEDLGLKTNFRKKLIFACSSHLRES